jgi:hypothetical protein
MKTTGRYCRTESGYDIDHEINCKEIELQSLIRDIDDNGDANNKLKILINIMDSINKEIQNTL